MKFRSTRGSTDKVDFRTAVLTGMAPDGGLWVPEVLPTFRVSDFYDFAFPKIAGRILRPFMLENFPAYEVDEIAQASFRFPVTLKPLNSDLSVLELFHGPTAAFKDIAAQFLGEILGRLRQRDMTTILVATSGDTGGAVAAAFSERPGFRVIILFPSKGVSPLQKHQLSCWGANIFSLAVDGSFDDCQRMVKSLLQDQHLTEKFNLTSANSINIARLLPQTTYYGAAALWWWRERREKARFIIPTGNMGNAVAAFWARKMGFPIDQIVMATNANRVVETYYKTGEFNPLPTVSTLANAMDVGAPSNFERLQSMYPNIPELRAFSNCISVSDDEIRESIIRAKNQFGEVICPHTATAMAVREQLGGSWVVVATAHPAKFSEIVKPLINGPVTMPDCLQEILELPLRYQKIPAEEKFVIDLLER